MTENVVRSARIHLKMQRKELADVFGVAQSTIFRWENDHVPVPDAVMIALSFMLLVPQDHWPPVLADRAEEAA